MSIPSRRDFIRNTASLAAAAVLSSRMTSLMAAERKLKLCLSPGAIGVSASQSEAIDLAVRYGFEAVDPNAGFLASLSEGQLQELLAGMKSKGISWGAAGLPVDFRQDEAKFDEGMAALVKVAPVLQEAGVTRVTTWVMPCSRQLTYRQNFEIHVVRLRAAAKVLADHGQRLGLEYVGTQTLRDSQKYPFIHTMAETRELIGEIGTGNVGVVLDSWHWWTAGDSQADILALKNEDIVLIDLDDAPAGIPKEQQIDSQRELPAATGVIDIGQFLGAVLMVGYDGPMRAEPFNKALNDMDNDAACAATIAALKNALDRVPA
jgi:sugar phosphate isomerase/epimerase